MAPIKLPPLVVTLTYRGVLLHALSALPQVALVNGVPKNPACDSTMRPADQLSLTASLNVTSWLRTLPCHRRTGSCAGCPSEWCPQDAELQGVLAAFLRVQGGCCTAAGAACAGESNCTAASG